MHTTLIGGDWGSSNLRVFRFGDAGQILEQRDVARGVLTVVNRAFESTLSQVIGDWLDSAEVPILLCGMVGSRQGWAEAPYISCPARLNDLRGKKIRVHTASFAVSIVPGLMVRGGDGRLDVMRGEETQIFGMDEIRHPTVAGTHVVVTPGTHSKWAIVEGGRIVDFSTYMTGELFAVLRAHSILGKLMQVDTYDHAAFDHAAFELGVTRALEDPAITRLLFSVRCEGLFETIAPQALSEYLSGLLIGAEIGAAISHCARVPVTVVGSPQMTSLYQKALALAGVTAVTIVDGDRAVGVGLWQLAQENRP
jgi:2-dehydro-3-deoxygalactonokinase